MRLLMRPCLKAMSPASTLGCTAEAATDWLGSFRRKPAPYLIVLSHRTLRSGTPVSMAAAHTGVSIEAMTARADADSRGMRARFRFISVSYKRCCGVSGRAALKQPAWKQTLTKRPLAIQYR